jgi:hypothetical protein
MRDHRRAARRWAPHSERPTSQSSIPTQSSIPARQRAAIYLVLGGLWLSGCVWLLLDQFVKRSGPFDAAPHPWQPTILLIHGIVAIAGMYLLGWVTACHVLRWWPSRLRRLSGGTLATFLTLLVVSGFALFFVSDDQWQRIAAVTHDVLGVGVTVFGIQHWFFARRRDMRSAASRP